MRRWLYLLILPNSYFIRYSLFYTSGFLEDFTYIKFKKASSLSFHSFIYIDFLLYLPLSLMPSYNKLSDLNLLFIQVVLCNRQISLTYFITFPRSKSHVFFLYIGLIRSTSVLHKLQERTR